MNFKSSSRASTRAALAGLVHLLQKAQKPTIEEACPGERRLRALLVVVIFVAAVGAAQPQSLRVVGTAGYVSEWELSGETTPTVAGPTKEFQIVQFHLSWLYAVF
jgi:hypothetical protein